MLKFMFLCALMFSNVAFGSSITDNNTIIDAANQANLNAAIQGFSTLWVAIHLICYFSLASYVVIKSNYSKTRISNTSVFLMLSLFIAIFIYDRGDYDISHYLFFGAALFIGIGFTAATISVCLIPKQMNIIWKILIYLSSGIIGFIVSISFPILYMFLNN